MTKLKLLSVFICTLLVSPTTIAQMYKWVDEEGNISYSDQPPYKGADQLEAPALNTVPATSVPKKAPADDTDTEEDVEVANYTELKITSPQDDMTIRDNTGTFSISFSVTPALDTDHGHYFSVIMNGKTVKNKLTSTTASFTNIDRGTQKIIVVVKNKKGKTLRKSKAISIHLHRQRVIRKQAR